MLWNLKKNHPDIDVSVTIDNSETIQQYVLENKIDFGLIAGKANNKYIIQIPFRDDELVSVCAKDHRFANRADVEISDFCHENFMLREKGSAGRETFDSAMSAKGYDIVPTWESTSTQAIVQAIKAGLGISVLPYSMIKENIKKGEIVEFRLKDFAFSRHFSIIYHKNKFLTLGAKDFMALCK